VAKTKQAALLSRGVSYWNEWHTAHRDERVDFSGESLSGGNFVGVDFRMADLSGAHLSGAYLIDANLQHASLRGTYLLQERLHGANLRGAQLSRADFTQADLNGADLSQADLHNARLHDTNLSGADLTMANLTAASLLGTNLENAKLSGARVHGTAVWDTKLDGAIQDGLVITPYLEPEITVDNLQVAQLIYLILNNAVIRDVIDSLTSKAVLILGRFSPQRKATLDALRKELRKRNYLPIMFDFEKPVRRDFTETVSTLAHLSPRRDCRPD